MLVNEVRFSTYKGCAIDSGKVPRTSYREVGDSKIINAGAQTYNQKKKRYKVDRAGYYYVSVLETLPLLIFR